MLNIWVGQVGSQFAQLGFIIYRYRLTRLSKTQRAFTSVDVELQTLDINTCLEYIYPKHVWIMFHTYARNLLYIKRQHRSIQFGQFIYIQLNYELWGMGSK
jgi:hypothetical protein